MSAVTLVIIQAASQQFAIDVMSVRELRGWTQPVPLPRAPPFVQGMSDLRGAVIPIVDLAASLGFRPIQPSPSNVVVVVQIRDRMAGLVVESVCELITVDAAALQATPETGSSAPSEVLTGTFDVDGRIFGLIAVDRVIPPTLSGAGRDDIGERERLAS